MRCGARGPEELVTNRDHSERRYASVHDIGAVTVVQGCAHMPISTLPSTLKLLALELYGRYVTFTYISPSPTDPVTMDQLVGGDFKSN